LYLWNFNDKANLNIGTANVRLLFTQVDCSDASMLSINKSHSDSRH